MVVYMVVGGWSLPQEQCTPPSCDCECLLGYHHLHGLAPTIFDPSISYHPNVPSGSAFITLSPRSQHKQSRNASAPSRPTAGAPCSELPDANRPAGQRRRSPGWRRARPPPRRRAGRHPHGRSRSRTPGRRTYARAVRGAATRARRLHVCCSDHAGSSAWDPGAHATRSSGASTCAAARVGGAAPRGAR